MVSPVPLPPLSCFTFGRLSASCQATVLKFDTVTENHNKQIENISENAQSLKLWNYLSQDWTSIGEPPLRVEARFAISLGISQLEGTWNLIAIYKFHKEVTKKFQNQFILERTLRCWMHKFTGWYIHLLALHSNCESGIRTILHAFTSN